MRLIIALSFLLCALPGAETPPPGPVSPGSATTAAAPDNTVDPLTGLPVDPTIGTLEVELAAEPLAQAGDPAAPGTQSAPGTARLVRIGFSSPESRETVRMADRSTRQRYARAAIADKPLRGGLAPAR